MPLRGSGMTKERFLQLDVFCPLNSSFVISPLSHTRKRVWPRRHHLPV